RGQAQRADSILSRARIQLGGTGDLQLEIAQTRAATGQWEESARAWRVALVSAPYLEQAAAYALAPAPNEIRDAIRAQFFAPPLRRSTAAIPAERSRSRRSRPAAWTRRVSRIRCYHSTCVRWQRWGVQRPPSGWWRRMTIG